MTFKGLWAEFKDFAFKGNMIELAVAVIIGAAFGQVINSLVQDIIMPTVSYAVTAANETATDAAKMAKAAADDIERKKHVATTQAQDSSDASNTPAAAVPAAPVSAPATATPTNTQAVNITWTIGRIKIGNFLGQLLNFLIVSFAVFITIVKMIGGVVKKVSHTAPTSPTTKECPFCLSNIPIKAKKCEAHCTADLPKA